MVLGKKEFVGTQSRFGAIFESIKSIVQKATTNPVVRVNHLKAQRQEVDLEISSIQKTGIARRMDETLIREKFLNLIEDTRRLISDFCLVEDIFKDLTASIKRRKIQETVQRGMILGEVLDAYDYLEESDQGKSFDAFWQFLLSSDHPSLVFHENVNTGDSAKTEYLKLQLPKLAELGRKTVVFSQFATFLHLIQKHLDKLGIPNLLIDGQTVQRDDQVQLFKSSRDIPVLLASIRVGGVGLNLTAADTCILMEPWWNPAVEQQAIDRIYRIGQHNDIEIYRLICKDSIEEKMLGLQEIKGDRARQIRCLSDEDLALLSQKDLKALLGL